jgi:hypothetical protein
MEPINTINNNNVIRYKPPSSIATAPTVESSNNRGNRPEFVSPKGSIDAKTGVYVVQFRNSSTGNVNFQYPNKKVVAEYSRADNLVPTLEVKSQVTSAESRGDAAPVEVVTPSSEGSVGVAPLGTIDNA